MVEIRPFMGIRYSDEIEIKKVVAPPYDVISEELKEEYYNRHENNIIHLILGRKYDGDTSQDNSYTRACAYFNKWLGEGILKVDMRPSIYILEQEYFAGDKKKKMQGIISLVKLEEYENGEILPHEETLDSAIKDRLSLMSTCSANFSQIFTMYSDHEGTVEGIIAEKTKEPPVSEVKIDSIISRLWRVDDPGVISLLKSEMKEKKLFIADGHHRYATALKLRDQMREKTKSDAYDYTMMYYTNMESGGITILPAHRVLRRVNFDSSKMKKIQEYFEIDMVKHGEMLKKLKGLENSHHIFGMCYDGNCYLLRLKDENVMDRIIDSGKSKDWKRLDVTIIHSLLIDLVANGTDNISYVVDEKEAMRISEEKNCLVIFVSPTRVEEVKKIALNREKMPGKATYFYPKLLTGLVMNRVL